MEYIFIFSTVMKYYAFYVYVKTDVLLNMINVALFSQIKVVFERIRKAIADKPFQENVVRPFYAVENKHGAADKGVRLTKLLRNALYQLLNETSVSTSFVYLLKHVA